PRVSSSRRRGTGFRQAGVLGPSTMSAQDDIKRLTAPDIRARKGGEPIVFRHWDFEPVHRHAERGPDQNEIAVAIEQTRGMAKASRGSRRMSFWRGPTNNQTLPRPGEERLPDALGRARPPALS